MKKHDKLRKKGTVSIWIGNFKSNADLDDYMNVSRYFEKDFNFLINDRDAPEAVVENEATLIRSLVEGFSWSDIYIDSVEQLANRKGIKKATTMVVFLNFDYRPDFAASNPTGLLEFLGTVSFSSQSK